MPRFYDPEIASLRVRTTLRPLRCAILIAESSSEGFSKAISLATFNWGGRCWPIVPLLTALPGTDIDPLSRFKDSTEFVCDWISRLSPDFVLNLTGSEIPGPIRERHRVIEESHLYEWSETEESIGLHMPSVLAHVYATDLRFVLRDRRAFAHTESFGAAESLFCQAVFGSFVGHPALEAYKDQYISATDSEPSAYSLEDHIALQERGAMTPLALTLYATTPRAMIYHHAPSIVLMDMTSVDQVLRFWNLRAANHFVFPFPMQHRDEFEKPLRSVLEYCATWFRRPELSVTILSGADAPELKILWDVIAQHKPENLLTFNTARFDPYYVPLTKSKDCPPHVSHEFYIKDHDLAVEASHVAVPVEVPPFAAESGSVRQLAVDIRISEGRSAKPGTISAWPAGRSNKHHSFDMLFGESDIKRDISMLTAYPWARRESVHVHIPTPAHFSASVLEVSPHEVTRSPQGEICWTMLRMIRYPFLIDQLFGKEQVVHKFSRMTATHLPGARASDVEDEEVLTRRLQIQLQELRTKVGEDSRDEREVGAYVNTLIECGFLEVGLKLQCSVCRQYNWFGLNKLGLEMECPTCLGSFDFPVSPPPGKSWVHRLRGPLALPNLADGSVGVLLSLAWLMRQVGMSGGLSYDFGVELPEFFPGDIDLLAYYDFDGLSLRQCGSVAFEAKSFGKVQQKDIERLKDLAGRFPEIGLGLSTLKSTFDIEETALLRELVDADENSVSQRLVLLTANHLFKSQEEVERHSILSTGWRSAAAITQQAVFQAEGNQETTP